MEQDSRESQTYLKLSALRDSDPNWYHQLDRTTPHQPPLKFVSLFQFSSCLLLQSPFKHFFSPLEQYMYNESSCFCKIRLSD